MAGEWVTTSDKPPETYKAVLGCFEGVYRVVALSAAGYWFSADRNLDTPPCHWWGVELPEPMDHKVEDEED